MSSFYQIETLNWLFWLNKSCLEIGVYPILLSMCHPLILILLDQTSGCVITYDILSGWTQEVEHSWYSVNAAQVLLKNIELLIPSWLSATTVLAARPEQAPCSPHSRVRPHIQAISSISNLWFCLPLSFHPFLYLSMHYWLRPIKRGQFRFANFALILRENVTFTF